MRSEQVTYELLRAAIKHAKENAHGPTDRRTCAIFFLQCLQQDYIKARNFLHADLVRTLIRRANATRHLTSLLETVLDEAMEHEGWELDWSSNTSPTEKRAAKNPVEGEGMRAHTPNALELYIGGKSE